MWQESERKRNKERPSEVYIPDAAHFEIEVCVTEAVKPQMTECFSAIVAFLKLVLNIYF
jgi:hypothetical protein